MRTSDARIHIRTYIHIACNTHLRTHNSKHIHTTTHTQHIDRYIPQHTQPSPTAAPCAKRKLPITHHFRQKLRVRSSRVVPHVDVSSILIRPTSHIQILACTNISAGCGHHSSHSLHTFPPCMHTHVPAHHNTTQHNTTQHNTYPSARCG